jgi:hypothetical protein
MRVIGSITILSPIYFLFKVITAVSMPFIRGLALAFGLRLPGTYARVKVIFLCKRNAGRPLSTGIILWDYFSGAFHKGIPPVPAGSILRGDFRYTVRGMLLCIVIFANGVKQSRRV